MCVPTHTHPHADTSTAPLLAQKSPGLRPPAPGVEGALPGPSRPPARRCSCRLQVELGRLQCESSQFPATLRVKSILHKQEQRAGRETMNNTSEEEQASRGGGVGEGNSKVPALPSDQGMGGPVSQAPLWERALGWVGTSISSPSSTRGLLPQVPRPHHRQDKGAIEGLRRGRMPRGCRSQIKGKETQPSLPPVSLREGGQDPGLLGSRLKIPGV